MPADRVKPSTSRRHRLCDLINSFGEVMVTKCLNCASHGRICKVHVRSGKCGECLRRGAHCNVRVTESEFKRLVKEKDKLRGQIADSRAAQDAAMRAHEKALEDLRVARAREERLRKQMELIDRRAEEAISVEERSIEELECQERGDALEEISGPPGGFSLPPLTWGLLDGIPPDSWEDPSLWSVDNTAPVAGSA
jgi:hypothetical protein